MERDGLLVVEGDRHLHLTDVGRQRAVAVMRKHRLAELLLVNVIGMPYEEAHDEACRWEHVMSDAVEKRVGVARPTHPFPVRQPDTGVGGLRRTRTERGRHRRDGAKFGLSRPPAVVVRRICESVVTDVDVLRQLHAAGVDPGATVTVAQERDGVTIDRSRTGSAAREVACGCSSPPAEPIGPAGDRLYRRLVHDLCEFKELDRGLVDHRRRRRGASPQNEDRLAGEPADLDARPRPEAVTAPG
jgi:DtxR family Mn-dependent transcriptional regulator